MNSVLQCSHLIIGMLTIVNDFLILILMLQQIVLICIHSNHRYLRFMMQKSKHSLTNSKMQIICSNKALSLFNFL